MFTKNEVALVCRQSSSFVVSGSSDLTIKLWSIPKELDVTATVPLSSKFTEKAHDKDINTIVVSPNDKFIATGSVDKTAKVSSTTNSHHMSVSYRNHFE